MTETTAHVSAPGICDVLALLQRGPVIVGGQR